MNAKKILIVNINNYAGGPIVLASLCAELRKLGYDARLYLVPSFKHGPYAEKEYKKECLKYGLNRLIKEIQYRLLHRFIKFYSYRQPGRSCMCVPGIKMIFFPLFNPDNTIVVYPEDLFGNPLNAKHVVRWFLYFDKYGGVSGAYGPNDLHIAYREVFNPIHLNPTGRIVTINYIDNQLYRQYNFEERIGKCYILYKGENREDLPTQYDGPVFNGKMTQLELVDMLNKHKYCYIYDTQTFYATIAAVCGCIPIVVLEQGKTERDYLFSSEKHLGVAYGDTTEQIQYAIDTRQELLNSLDFSENNRKNAQHMVDLLIERFGMLRKI